VPFVCGCRDLGEALRRIGEGAALLRTKGEAGTGNVVEAVRHLRRIRTEIRRLGTLGREERMAEAKTLGAPYDLVTEVAETDACPCRASPPEASRRPPTQRSAWRSAHSRSSSGAGSSCPRIRRAARARSSKR
jgi:hypothetical protein